MSAAPVIRLRSGCEVRLGDGVSPVGRGPQMTVQLDDPTVSGLHAEPVRRGPYVYVEDLGLSRNGTWVNGRPIARRRLADGDRICFGGPGASATTTRGMSSRTCRGFSDSSRKCGRGQGTAGGRVQVREAEQTASSMRRTERRTNGSHENGGIGRVDHR